MWMVSRHPSVLCVQPPLLEMCMCLSFANYVDVFAYKAPLLPSPYPMVHGLYDTCISHVKIVSNSAYPPHGLHEAYTFSVVETTCVCLSTCTWYLTPSLEGTRIYLVGSHGGRLVWACLCRAGSFSGPVKLNHGKQSSRIRC